MRSNCLRYNQLLGGRPHWGAFGRKMEIRKSIEECIASRPNAKVCLHNGFAGFSYGCPSNPIFLDKDYAIKIIEKVIETEHKSLKELLYLDTLISIEKVFPIFPELDKIGYRYIGLNIESECLYGDTGLG